MTTLLSNHHQENFLPAMSRHQNDYVSASSIHGWPYDGISFSADQWTGEQISWAPYQTAAGAQDFPIYQTAVGHTYRQTSKSGAGVHTNQNAHIQDFQNFTIQTAAAKQGSHHNSPAFSAADVASLHSEVSLETQSSNYFSSVSNNCSPSIPDIDGSYDLGEFDGMDAFQQSGYPMSTGAASPGAFSSVAMSRGNSLISNMQHFHHSPPTYAISLNMDMPLFDDSHSQTAPMPQNSTSGKGGRRRNQPDSSNAARSHPYYHSAVVGPDGLYHCPWENNTVERCNHKPEKLKCNYDKCIDSHLKPYRCKIAACAEASFSSTACLLRHEREAHAMHGHGEKPFNCELTSCERSIPGNGFPRHWNLCDHMSRVHGLKAKPQDPEKATKGSRKRKNATGDAAVKKPRASKSPKKEPITPPASADIHLAEQKRRIMEAIDQQLDLNDPRSFEKIAKLQYQLRT